MNKPVETRDLRAFILLAEELHFGAAAKRLAMAQPALSQQIRRLERSLGARLFDRTTRSVRLTAAGRMFLAKSTLAMNQIEDGARLARLVAAGAEGQLSIGFVQAAIYHGLNAAIGRFGVRFPSVRLQVTHLGSPEQIKALLEGRIDLGIIRPPISGGGLQMEVIAREGFAVALPACHRLAGKARIGLKDLAGEAFIHYRSADGDAFPQIVAPYCRLAGFEPRFVHETSTTAATLCLVAADIGIAILPRWVRHVSPAEVIFRPIREIPAIVELAAAWVPETAPATMLQMLDMLRAGSPANAHTSD